MTNSWRFARRGTFWSAAAVLALCLWSSGAPSVLYPVYAAEWDLPAVITTSVFAAYPLALLVVLLAFGGLSDAIGRRRAMLLGIGLIAVAAAVFALAPNVGWLFAGRVLQGIGTGFALGAASAALVENNPGSNPRTPSILTTVSTATGLTLALVVSGVLAQFLPLPLVLSFAVLFVLSAVGFVAVWRTPDDRAVRPAAPDAAEAVSGRVPDRASGVSGVAGPGGDAPHGRLYVPRGIRLAFAAASASVATAYSVGAIFLSLGAQMARELTGTSDFVVIGGLLGISSIAIGVTALFLGRLPSHLAVLIGAGLSLVSLAVMALAAAAGSIVLFLVWCLVGGIAYSFAFTGGLGLVNRTAPARHRGATLSLLYLFSYLFQALTAVGAGALATAIGLGPAVDLAAPLVGVLALLAGVLAGADLVAARRGRSRAAVAAVEVPVAG
ncbi:MFS transporter [Herbiconiux sp. YIM B11900]|uniref:MFS transporter n=1 Tax=Herbiconiux sp. YIM B11900 TaxID=3404131 RepID=UPI003F8543E6